VLDQRELECESEGKKLEMLHRSKEQRYFFDRIFKFVPQEEVYRKACSHLVAPVLRGYNATVFAYGTTVLFFFLLNFSGFWKNIYNGWL
jgi:kinesin family member 18/19